MYRFTVKSWAKSFSFSITASAWNRFPIDCSFPYLMMRTTFVPKRSPFANRSACDATFVLGTRTIIPFAAVDLENIFFFSWPQGIAAALRVASRVRVQVGRRRRVRKIRERNQRCGTGQRRHGPSATAQVLVR